MKKKFARTVFDKGYYHKFYVHPHTRAIEKEDLKRLVAHVAHYLNYLGVRITNVLDIGCGLGMWQKALKKYYPCMNYTGVETSKYLCDKYGWKCGSVAGFKSRQKYDLIICQSVFQYLNTKDARSGLKNLAKLCRGAFYLEIVTKEDWEYNCEHSTTDDEIHLRSADWYRKEISRHFINCGGGIFIPKDSPTVLYELEKTE